MVSTTCYFQMHFNKAHSSAVPFPLYVQLLNKLQIILKLKYLTAVYQTDVTSFGKFPLYHFSI